MLNKLRELGPGRLLVLGLAVVALLLLGGRLLVNLYVELLWQGTAGYLSVFWTRTLWGWGTRILAGVLVAVALFLNLRIVARTLGGIQIKRRFGNLEINEQLPERYVLWGMLGISALLGLWFGGSVTPDTGLRLLLALRGGEWGLVEPVLGRDVSFYVFILPLLRTAVAFGLITAFLVLAVSVAGYVATGSVSWSEEGLLMGREPRVHLGLLVAAFILLLAAQFWLGRYVLLQFGSSDVQGIFGYTDAQARLPGLRILTFVTLASGFLVAWGAWKNRVAPLAAGIATVVVGGLVLSQLYPSLVQRFQVEPNELVRETPWIERNLQFTRIGFGLEALDRRRFAYTPPDEGGGVDWEAARAQFDGLPVWTDNTLLTTFREIEARFDYYEFAAVDIDRYRLPDGSRVPVALSVREIDRNGIENQNWQNFHIRERYVSGMGAVAAAPNQRTAEGRPPMYLSGIPPLFNREVGTPSQLELTRPSVFVGIRPQLYAIATPGDSAYVAPDGSPGVAGVDFPEGIALGSPLRTLALAWRFRDPNLIFAQEITDASRFVWRRAVRERVEAIAPFLAYPEEPYPVVHEGRVVWILEGFTATRGFPLSSPHALSFRAPATYVRNSVKVTVDAVTGEVAFYRLPGQDPLLDAFDASFPGLLRPIDGMAPALREHIRYARSLLDVQASVLLQYHQDSAPQFFGQQDVWDLPQELSVGTSPVGYRPEYGLYRLPDEEEVGFYLTTVFIPQGRQNLTGILAGRLAPDGTPELTLFDVPVEDQVPGPRQVEALVEQDPQISQQFSLWRTGGSQVWTGHLHLVPVGGRILYLEAVFLAAEEDAIPQLRGFVVSDGNRVVMQPTLEGAIAALAARSGQPGTVPAVEDETDRGAPGRAADPGRPALDPSVWPAEALELLDRAEERLRSGDYSGFGAALEELRTLLRDLRDRADGGGGTPDSGAAPAASGGAPVGR